MYTDVHLATLICDLASVELFCVDNCFVNYIGYSLEASVRNSLFFLTDGASTANKNRIKNCILTGLLLFVK